MLTTLYLPLLWSTLSSYSVHPWDAHHSLPTATLEYSAFILTQYIPDHPGIPTTLYLLLLWSTPSSYLLSTAQDHPGMLTTLNLLLLWNILVSSNQTDIMHLT